VGADLHEAERSCGGRAVVREGGGDGMVVMVMVMISIKLNGAVVAALL